MIKIRKELKKIKVKNNRLSKVKICFWKRLVKFTNHCKDWFKPKETLNNIINKKGMQLHM